LGRMEQAGLITTTQSEENSTDERRARTFLITEDGRRRFYQLIMDMSSNLGDYSRIFHYKLIFFDLIESKERLLLFNHYINYCATSILYLQTERANLRHELSQQSSRVFLESIVRVMEHMEQQTQQELDWATRLRAEELARAQE
jgi:DNA-binding PadR family transcriptional regulator